MEESMLKSKSISFGLYIMDVCRIIRESKKEAVITKQLLRSGTAVGALIMEAEFAQSRADFIHKLSISLKEANESKYWISLLSGSGCLSEDLYETLQNLNTELIKMLVSSIKTAKINSSK